jgi:hypothetical protein
MRRGQSGDQRFMPAEALDKIASELILNLPDQAAVKLRNGPPVPFAQSQRLGHGEVGGGGMKPRTCGCEQPRRSIAIISTWPHIGHRPYVDPFRLKRR